MIRYAFTYDEISDRLLWRLANNTFKRQWLLYGGHDPDDYRREYDTLLGEHEGLLQAWEEVSYCYYGEPQRVPRTFPESLDEPDVETSGW